MTGNWGAFMQLLLQWKSDTYYIFWVWVCSHRYPACNQLASCCHLWPVRFYNIFFFHFISQTTLLSKKKTLLNTKCVFWFSLQLLSETSVILRNEREMIKILVLMWSARYARQFLKEPEFFRHIFETYSNIKFHENRSSESRDVPCGRTDRHDKANGRFS